MATLQWTCAELKELGPHDWNEHCVCRACGLTAEQILFWAFPLVCPGEPVNAAEAKVFMDAADPFFRPKSAFADYLKWRKTTDEPFAIEIQPG